MAITAAQLLGKEHAQHLSRELPGRFSGRLVDVGEDRGVRVSHKDGGKTTGFWEAVAMTSASTWVWWMPDQDVRRREGQGTLLAVVDAPLHYPREWASRVAEAISDAKERRDVYWMSPL